MLLNYQVVKNNKKLESIFETNDNPTLKVYEVQQKQFYVWNSEQYRSLRHTHTQKKKKTKNKQLNLPPKRIKKSIKNKTQSQPSRTRK